MNILTINCVDNCGSTGQIINGIAEELSEDCNFVFCYERGMGSTGNRYLIAKKYESLFYYALARLTGLKYSTGFTSTMRLISFIKKQQPDIVHLHCPNNYTVNIPSLLTFLKRSRIPTVITNHAEFYYTGNCPHSFECEKYKTGCGNCNYVFDEKRPFLFDRTAYEWKRMIKAFDGFEFLGIVAVSPWTKDRIMSSPILNRYDCTVVKNGIDVGVFKYYISDLKSRLEVPENTKVILHVTAVFSDSDDDPKGGRYIIRLARRLKNTKVIVVGPYRLESTNDIPSNIILIGQINNQSQLSEYYSASDLTVITSRRETFSMVCAESLCCGTPVVGFKAGGPESIALTQYSEFVEYGDEEALYQCVVKWLNGDSTSHEVISNESKVIYSKERMAREYYEQYKVLLEKRVYDK